MVSASAANRRLTGATGWHLWMNEKGLKPPADAHQLILISSLPDAGGTCSVLRQSSGRSSSVCILTKTLGVGVSSFRPAVEGQGVIVCCMLSRMWNWGTG
ncbi:uncharacterized protein QC763_000868 [Podospora pseudopauciseta]|uniref:Uncharacterized protein n=1 Tax=Podospora pseudopauciseta TaxID=2093780 RepID=A0ABR0HJX0_9PEZI|nr:hypothetical protein QC763_000868 [Podospora pseudopauciseta]